MKKWIFLALLLSMCAYQGQAASPNPIQVLSEHIAARLIAGGGTPIKGKAYLLADGPYLKVLQNTNSGILAIINTGIIGESPIILIRTKKTQVDNTYIPTPTCGVYTGITSYTNVLGSRSTVHAFNEVNCKSYRLPASWVKSAERSLVIEREKLYVRDKLKPYLKQASYEIQHNWDIPYVSLPQSGPEDSVIISATLSKDGKWLNAQIEQSCEKPWPEMSPYDFEQIAMWQAFKKKYQIVDNSALNAVLKTSLPPVPEGAFSYPLKLKIKMIYAGQFSSVKIEYLSSSGVTY